MQLNRIVIKNYRSLKFVDVLVAERTTCIIGENNTGKSNLVQALRLCLPVKPDLTSLENAYVKLLLGETTFEREITTDGNIMMLAESARALGAPRIARKIDAADLIGVDDELKNSVLRTAKRFGNGRFAQVAARHVTHATEVPGCIVQAIQWLREP